MECPRIRYSLLVIAFLLVSLVNGTFALAQTMDVGGPTLVPKKGRFLVATDNLAGTSFKETVILVTHFSARGATGIAINRSAHIPMNEAFPSVKELSDVKDSLYLGGPVQTNGIFVLMKTKRPHAGMKNITDDIYFTVGLNAIIHGLPKATKGEATRAYAGFAGWAPGQLQLEIERGDWLIVEAESDIVFAEEPDSLWKRLRKSWSGDWI